MSPKQPLLDLSAAELLDWFAARDLPGYRARQVRRWVFEKRAGEFSQMTDLPQALRERLAEEFDLLTMTIVRRQTADDGTEKLLLQTADQQQVECVMLCDDRGHRTACVSVQVGCAMGCAFCASGLDGLVRNLSGGEILQQMLLLQQLLDPQHRISHLVVMGMGEPLANLEGLLPALAAASDPQGLGIGARRITISTVGLPAGIRRLAALDVQYHLAVSLHAADDQLRNQLVPANRKLGIAKILGAADAYFAATGRRVTYEYVLLGGVNDRVDDALKLVGLLRDRTALVNLIPYNPVPGLPYRTPSPSAVGEFAERLRQGGLSVQVRHRKGDRIDAACGQLRRRSQ